MHTHHLGTVNVKMHILIQGVCVSDKPPVDTGAPVSSTTQNSWVLSSSGGIKARKCRNTDESSFSTFEFGKMENILPCEFNP